MLVTRCLSAAVVSLAVTASSAAAQQFEILHAFQAPLANVKAPMVLASDGALYGTFATGGQHGVGAIFVTRPQADGSVVTQYLRALERSQGGGVVDALVEGHDGWLYGVAPEHGAHGRGTVFKFHRVTGQLVVLHAFSGPDGAAPRGPIVVGDDGNYYGMTTAEGASGGGTVFKLTPAGALTTLHAFSDGVATGLLVQAADGNLYGVNGPHVFRLTLTGARTVLRTLTSPLGPPFFPIAKGLVEGADGHLYAVLVDAPIGTAFFARLSLDGAFTEIYRIADVDVAGQPDDRVPLFVAADGSLLGTLPYWGPNLRGTLFRVTTTGTFNVLHAFTVQEGRAHSGVVRHPNGHFYGTTVEGGLTGHGMIYSVGFGGSLVVRHTFTPLLPYAPSAPPIEGPDGALYGTTIAGGIFNRGTVYRLSSSGFTVLYNFMGLDGSHPVGKLVLGSDGKFYGTTHGGGASSADAGTIFRISPSGVHETLHTFLIFNGRNPTAGLVRAADGTFWGTTLRGGSADTGTIFTISPTGAFTLVHAFVFNATGDTMVFPYAGLIQAQDGNFYGTTYGFTDLWGGTVFRVTPQGAVTMLRQFVGFFDIFNPGGRVPGPKVYAGLIEHRNGQLYGGSCCGGSIQGGDRTQVFQVDASGAVTMLRDLNGRGVFAALTEGGDQALYGATLDDVLFRLETNGDFTELKTLAGLDGLFVSGLRTAGDWIMGSAYAGGPAGGGVIFRFKHD
jgi:uncharacterized repeat protein (TIGR03803 family)